ncbi:hypothetical protein P0D75_08475 [Paraburkholderia sediminicola]|uniref:hypothetical protein n=1 Tax=Paraburkholderia sediminicola TaxID=458836 RepID=UPI0011C38E16
MKLKREVADPHKLIKDILEAKLPGAAAVKAAKKNPGPSVASILSSKKVVPSNMNARSSGQCPSHPSLSFHVAHTHSIINSA